MLQIVPRLVDASVLVSKKAKIASSGARHSAILTGKMDLFIERSVIKFHYF